MSVLWILGEAKSAHPIKRLAYGVRKLTHGGPLRQPGRGSISFQRGSE